MSETIDQQYAEITKLNRNIEALNFQIRKKDETIAKLTESISKYEKPKKNSGNSNMPPSRESMNDESIMRTKLSASQVTRSLAVKKGMRDINYPALLLQTKYWTMLPTTVPTAVSLLQMLSVCLTM